MESTRREINTLRHPQFFIQTPNRQLRCLLCGTSGLTPSKAHKHEDTGVHVHRVRRESRRSLEEDGVGDNDANAPTPSPLREGWPMDRLESPPSFSDWETNPGTYDQYLHQKEGFATISGPQLPSDPVDAIYDDYGGDLSLLGGLPSHNEDSVDTEDPPPPPPPPHSPSFEDPFNRKGELKDKEPASGYNNAPPPPAMPARPDPEGWLPWTNEPDCLLTALAAFPRALFSQPELEVLTWFSGRLGISGLSSVDQLRSIRTRISDTFGSKPCLATSAAGNIFSHNSLKTIIAHELANPISAAKLSTFPEDAGEFVSGPLHGAKWRDEVEGSFASPMARLHGRAGSYQDYFVDEPALVKIGDLVVPVLVSRWFMRNKSLVANVHRLVPLAGKDGYAIDGGNCLEVPEQDFHLALPDFRKVYAEYGLPAPDHILALWPKSDPEEAVPWTEPVENPWRARANGKEVISVPILGYCDDTSGNMSKKWNKHNSYLFVLAGLPREDIQSPYNVHFLATSNIASPLEMLEAIVQEAEEAAREGIWAYSAVKRDLVLAVAWWLALEGDNPMQSELSSHVGMNGKYFCRVCHVRGKDKQRAEDLEAEKERLKEFMTISQLRSQDDTTASLTTQLDEFMAKRFTASEEIATNTGVKDKYLGHFISTMKSAYNSTASKKRLTAKEGQELLKTLRSQLPERLFNPALYLPGIDVTQDTPVEVLHVVLLGITKYFWRDAVSRQDANHRSILIARLNSFDTRGLGMSRLDGRTLVQHAKSLTGGNFRDILQVAPAVLYDLLEPRVYDMWVALCYLAPLVFQPEIHNISAYIAALEARIDRLLLATVVCNPQWFNKPKFHVLLHLPNHVRRFGPPILFATETFESYNFVIRLRSVHSNRQAPSADIGASFSLMHALRHLVSGGYFQLPSESHPGDVPDAGTPWIQAGPNVRALLQDKTFVKFMGLSGVFGTSSPGLCVPLPNPHAAPVSWTETLAFTLSSPAPIASPPDSVTRCRSVKLGDKSNVSLEDFVLVRAESSTATSPAHSSLALARVCEILADSFTRNALVVTIKPFDIGPPVLPYQFPAVLPNEQDMFGVIFSNIVTSLSVFHDCAKHKCPLSQSRQRRQERQILDSYEDEVQHSSGPSDLILNLAQLRSAETIHLFYPGASLAYPTRDEAIAEGITFQQQQESKRKADQEAKETGRAKKKEVKEERQAKKRKTS